MKFWILSLLTFIMCFLLGCSQISSHKPKSSYINSNFNSNSENIGNKCKLSGGEVVPYGWSGKDSGSNYCNHCKCMAGGLACTKMLCGYKQPLKKPLKKPLMYEFAYKDFWNWYQAPEMEAAVMVRGFRNPSRAAYAAKLTGVADITFEEAKKWQPPSGWVNPYI